VHGHVFIPIGIEIGCQQSAKSKVMGKTGACTQEPNKKLL
jgi:hypothetical protein